MTKPKRAKLSEHVRQRTQEWFRKAEHELAYLSVAPLNIDDPPTDTTCRMAHMTAEYALKAYLMLNKSRIPKNHDLVMILDECIAIHNDEDFEVLRANCQILSTYRTDLVYPSPFPTHVSIEEAKSAINYGTECVRFCVE